MERIFEAIRLRCPLPESSEQKLRNLLHHSVFKPRQYLVEEGRRSGYAYFLASGMTRSFWLDNGQEVTTSFSVAGALVFSMDELYYGQVSQEYVQAIETVEAYAIAVDDLLHLWQTDLALSNWARLIHQDEYRRIHQSHRERLTLPAAERYKAFCRQFPEVCRRARLGYIASYLGITSETLSRLRRRDLF